MTSVVVTLDYGNRQTKDLGLPLDVSCRALTEALAQALNVVTDVGELLILVDQSSTDEWRLPPNATLGDLGILHGSRLGLIRQKGKEARPVPQGGASLMLEDGKEIMFKGAYFLVGRRDPKNGIYPDFDLSTLDVGKISSRKHATIEFDQRSYAIKDLRSANGTWLNGQRLQPDVTYQLKNGDEIVFGRKGVTVHFKRGE